jgi:hypothetical protein
MNRRSFFRGAVALPTLLAGAATMPAVASNTRITRVSMDRSDAVGHRNYCMCVGDRKTVKVYLDGEYQKYATAADSVEGWVKRLVTTPGGNIAHDRHEVLVETVYGNVAIVIGDAAPRRDKYRQYAIDDRGRTHDVTPL